MPDPPPSRLRVRAHIPGTQRLRLRLPDPRARGRAIVLAAVTLAILYGASMPPTADVGGTMVTASRVLVLRDGSGSMRGTDPLLAGQMNAALAAGVEIAGDVETVGFGMSATGDERNALRTLLRVLPATRPDAIYLFSDFDNQTASFDDSDPAGLAQLQTLLDTGRLRLYLSSVRLAPEPALVDAAIRSGGGLITAAP